MNKMMKKILPALFTAALVISPMVFATSVAAPATDFIAFESGPVRPIAIDHLSNRLYMVNTADNRLEIYSISNDGGLIHQQSLLVGLEPVTVAVKDANAVWVVNHLSDSISIVDVSQSVAQVKQTLLVGDAPRDLVFASTGKQKAFITTAHRGQHRSASSLDNVPGAGDPKLTQGGIGRADVWVFDSNNPGQSLGGKPLKIIELFADTPRALAVSVDLQTVYAAAFFSGNQTTVVHDGMVCDTPLDGDAQPCAGDGVQVPGGLANGQSPGGLPLPYFNAAGDPTPEVALIVQYDRQDATFKDELGRNWNNAVRFDLPDQDVFALDATTLNEKRSFAHAGTILYNMAVNPVNGNLYVSNTEANNAERFEGAGARAGHTLQGELHRSQITVINPTTGKVTPRHINRHINYDISPAPSGTKQHSLALPSDITVSADGKTLYVAAFGSGKVGVFATESLEDDTLWDNQNNEFDPTVASSRYITVSGGGVSGVVLNEGQNRLYVTTRFDNGLSIIDLEQGKEIEHISHFTPEPPQIIEGRQLLYDAAKTFIFWRNTNP
ncbi:MAG: DNA-binding beta-propeller fold protein YncE [Phenylobacterium sp.]|jgi:DNA-binding beta-propeller fold protein YncE